LSWGFDGWGCGRGAVFSTVTGEEAVVMVSLDEELKAREAAAGRDVESLEVQLAELADRVEAAREKWTRLRVTRETVTAVMAEMSTVVVPEALEVPVMPEGAVPEAGRPGRVVGSVMVPHWREGMSADVLPDVYRDIVEIVMDAPGPLQAEQVAPRIGLPAVAGKIEGTRGKLKRLVERGWLREDAPGRFGLGRPTASGDR